MIKQDGELSQLHKGDGDNVAGNKYEIHKHKYSPTDLLTTLNEFEDEFGENKEAVEFIEELADYLRDYPGRKVIGLEGKLKQAEMESLYEEAKVLKQRFVKKLFRGQLSNNTQQLYAQTLALINTFFSHKIKPLIKNGATSEIIEDALLEEVFLPIFQNTSKVDMSITIDHIRGMLYFLTGKCHTKWT